MQFVSSPVGGLHASADPTWAPTCWGLSFVAGPPSSEHTEPIQGRLAAARPRVRAAPDCTPLNRGLVREDPAAGRMELNSGWLQCGTCLEFMAR